jgi:hypothetical protein
VFGVLVSEEVEYPKVVVKGVALVFCVAETLGVEPVLGELDVEDSVVSIVDEGIGEDVDTVLVSDIGDVDVGEPKVEVVAAEDVGESGVGVLDTEVVVATDLTFVGGSEVVASDVGLVEAASVDLEVSEAGLFIGAVFLVSGVLVVKPSDVAVNIEATVMLFWLKEQRYQVSEDSSLKK